MSDHYVVCLLTEIPKLNPPQVTTSLRNYRNIDKDNFSESLKAIAESFEYQDDVESAFEWYHKEIGELLNSVAPHLQ